MIFQMQLEEMNELIADKNIFIQEKEQQIMLMEQEKDQLDRENRVHLQKKEKKLCLFRKTLELMRAVLGFEAAKLCLSC